MAHDLGRTLYFHPCCALGSYEGWGSSVRGMISSPLAVITPPLTRALSPAPPALAQIPTPAVGAHCPWLFFSRSPPAGLPSLPSTPPDAGRGFGTRRPEGQGESVSERLPSAAVTLLRTAMFTSGLRRIIRALGKHQRSPVSCVFRSLLSLPGV